MAERVVGIRCDASREIGSGHVMRCLVIADALSRLGYAVTFICREFPWHLAHKIVARGHGVELLPLDDEGWANNARYGSWIGADPQKDAEQTATVLSRLIPSRIMPFVVVDHYGLDKSWHGRMRQLVKSLIVIDDLHDRALDCDLLVDQNVGHSPHLYNGLVPCHATRLVGARYAPIDPSFQARRDGALRRRSGLSYPKRLLVAVGGVDADNITQKTLEANNLLGNPFEVDVVLSGIAMHLDAIRKAVSDYDTQVRLHIDTPEMARLMSFADLAVGACGVTAIERCVVGLPSLVVIAADNQIDPARQISRTGAARVLGRSSAVDARQIAAELATFIKDNDLFQRTIAASAALCDGTGLSRIVAKIEEVETGCGTK